MSLDAWRGLAAESSRIVFFGGAGTSTESGIPDFRSENGLFHTSDGAAHSPEEMLSAGFFKRQPEEFYRFYREKMIYRDARPNAGHEVLARLEAAGRLRALITQNIDGLHQMAGNRNVLELHGSVHRNQCLACRTFHTLNDWIDKAEAVPRCVRCGGMIKPEVVLYGEPLDERVFAEAERAIAEADMLIVAGTSLSVYPAAGLIRAYSGKRLVLINKTPTGFDARADWIVREPFASAMQALADGAL